MFAFTGGALSKIRHMQNGGKRARHSIDQWDKVYWKARSTNDGHELIILQQSISPTSYCLPLM